MSVSFLDSHDITSIETICELFTGLNFLSFILRKNDHTIEAST